MEARSELVELKEKMELIGFLSLGCLTGFLVITLVTFLIAECFNRIDPKEYSEKEVKSGGRLSAKDKKPSPEVKPVPETSKKLLTVQSKPKEIPMVS